MRDGNVSTQVLLDVRIACFTKDMSQDVLLTVQSNETTFARDHFVSHKGCVARLTSLKNFLL